MAGKFDLSINHLGELFIVGLNGPSLLKEEEALLAKLRPVGIIIFKHNLIDGAGWREALKNLIENVRQCTGRNNLIISIDHEGGRVHRLPPPVTHFPAAKKWREESVNVARAMGRELRELGFNLSFAPVLDTLVEPTNSVIGDRAFSSQIEEVSRYALDYFHGLEREGIIACGKHFPGHGGTLEDSHHTLPVRNCSREELLVEELVPFRRLCEAGLPLMMTAHVIFPALDSSLPATLSPVIIGDLLRNQLGFKGVVISDALEMGALAGVSIDRLPVNLLNAGVDLFLIGQLREQLPVARALEMAESILLAMKDKALTPDTIINCRRRIGALVDYSTNIRRQAASACTDSVGCEAHRMLAEKLHLLA